MQFLYYRRKCARTAALSRRWRGLRNICATVSACSRFSAGAKEWNLTNKRGRGTHRRKIPAQTACRGERITCVSDEQLRKCTSDNASQRNRLAARDERRWQSSPMWKRKKAMFRKRIEFEKNNRGPLHAHKHTHTHILYTGRERRRATEEKR